MMRICQAALWTDCEHTQYQDNGGQQYGENLKPYMQAHCQPRVSPVETGNEDCGWHNEQKGNGGEDSMGSDNLVVIRQASEAISHACE
jgi:hypothetical protein